MNLSPDEFLPLAKRCELFSENMQKLKSLRGLKTLCLKEKKYQEKFYPNISTRHKNFTKYRNLVRNHLENESYRDLCLDILKLSEDEMEERNSLSKQNRNKKMRQVATFDQKEFLRICQEKIQYKKDPELYAIIMGIMGLTGRRSIEILKTGQFKSAGSNKKSLYFSGQAKTKDSPFSRENYEIPVLGDPKEILSAFRFLRKMLQNYPIKDMEHKEIDDYFGTKIRYRTKNLLQKITLTDNISFSCRSLRIIYANTAYHINKMEDKMAFNAYAANILGHTEEDMDTANSYTYFKPKKYRTKDHV